MTRFSVWPAALLALSGCATNLHVTFLSQPPGATIYAENGAPIATAPARLNFGHPPEFDSGGCIGGTKNFTARWVSGAETKVLARACAAQGWDQTFVFVRPPNTPGADVDANYAVQAERNAILRQQAQAAQSAAAANAAGALLAPPPRPVNCTTSTFAGVTRTTCQ